MWQQDLHRRRFWNLPTYLRPAGWSRETCWIIVLKLLCQNMSFKRQRFENLSTSEHFNLNSEVLEKLNDFNKRKFR